MTPRLTHKCTDALPEIAWQVMTTGFEQRKPYRVISAELAALGIVVPERTIARRRSEWAAEERRRETLKLLGSAGTAQGSWQFEELMGIMESLDLGFGAQLRARKRVQKALAAFLGNPSADVTHALETELLCYRLQALTLQRPQNTESLASEETVTNARGACRR